MRRSSNSVFPSWFSAGCLVFAVMLSCAFAAAPGGANPQTSDNARDAAPLSAIVEIKARSLPDARSASSLGVSREGSGVVIREADLVLTIGYLVIEAEGIEVRTRSGKSVPASVIGYDHATGFGLLRTAWPLDAEPLELGRSSQLDEGDGVMIASFGGPESASLAYVVSRREFPGYWEYLLDDAIFTFPARNNFAGAALISREGQLVGIGSLYVGDAIEPRTLSPGNVFVPIDLLKPILADLIASGRAARPARPWLGINTLEAGGRLVVTRVSPESPADLAGIHPGDVIVGVGSELAEGLADFYRKVWRIGAAGVTVPLRVFQAGSVREIRIKSIDRLEYFRKKQVL